MEAIVSNNRPMEPQHAMITLKEYMQPILKEKKTSDFRKFRWSPLTQWIWHSSPQPVCTIESICEIESAQARESPTVVIGDDGVRNREYDEKTQELKGKRNAHRIVSVWQLGEWVTLAGLKRDYGIRMIGAHTFRYVPDDMVELRSPKK